MLVFPHDDRHYTLVVLQAVKRRLSSASEAKPLPIRKKAKTQARNKMRKFLASAGTCILSSLLFVAIILRRHVN